LARLEIVFVFILTRNSIDCEKLKFIVLIVLKSSKMGENLNESDVVTMQDLLDDEKGKNFFKNLENYKIHGNRLFFRITR
jgi:uncharacterized protein Smg (DUF494 family)